MRPSQYLRTFEGTAVDYHIFTQLSKVLQKIHTLFKNLHKQDILYLISRIHSFGLDWGISQVIFSEKYSVSVGSGFCCWVALTGKEFCACCAKCWQDFQADKERLQQLQETCSQGQMGSVPIDEFAHFHIGPQRDWQVARRQNAFEVPLFVTCMGRTNFQQSCRNYCGRNRLSSICSYLCLFLRVSYSKLVVGLPSGEATPQSFRPSCPLLIALFLIDSNFRSLWDIDKTWKHQRWIGAVTLLISYTMYSEFYQFCLLLAPTQ